jgi:hypothetical protein
MSEMIQMVSVQFGTMGLHQRRANFLAEEPDYELQVFRRGVQGWQPYRHLWADCPDKNVGASTSDNPMGLHGLLRR